MTDQGSTSSSSGLGKTLLWLTVVCLAGLFIYKKMSPEVSVIDKITDVITPTTAVKLKYKPANFTFELEEEDALAILSNPVRYKREFDDLVYQINTALLTHIANRMNLPDSLQNNLDAAYQKHHNYLKELYFNDFMALKDTSAAFYTAWYGNESGSAVDALHEISSKYTCFLVNHVVTSLLNNGQVPIHAKGNKVDTPCGIALSEGLQPLIKRLRERAAVVDFSRSKNMLEQKVEKAIAQLATMEVRDKKGINKQLQTKIMGMDVSSTDIEISAVSILKVGFDLKQYFEINLDASHKKILVTLPSPTILSHEVYPKIDKLDIGWLREVKNADLNKNFNLLRAEFRREALESDLLDVSKQQAQELIQLLLSPILSNFQNTYQVKVNFQKNNLQQ